MQVTMYQKTLQSSPKPHQNLFFVGYTLQTDNICEAWKFGALANQSNWRNVFRERHFQQKISADFFCRVNANSSFYLLKSKCLVSAGYVQSGVGARVERIYRDTQAFVIPAGAEEIMLDYAGRTAAKNAVKLQSKL